MKQQGYIYLHKSILDWEWYDDINVFRLFMHLLLKANYTDTKWRGIKIKRGQHLTGRFSLSKETGLSEQQVRTALDKLISTNEITKQTTSHYTMIIVTNYDKFQGKQPAKQPTSNQQATTTIEGSRKNINIYRDSWKEELAKIAEEKSKWFDRDKKETDKLLNKSQ